MIEVLRSRHLSLGPRVPAFERAFAARVGAPHASAVSSGTAALHLALRAVGVTEGDEVITSPFSFVASRELDPVRARAAGVRRHRPGDAEPRRRRRRGGDHGSHDRACCRCTSSAIRPTRRRWSATGCRSSRTRARRSAPSTPTACRVGGRGHPAAFGFYANKQLTTGEGGMLTMGSLEHKEMRRLRAQPGPRAGHGLARPRPARLQLPAHGHRVRAGSGPAASAWTACSPPGRASRGWYREALAGFEGLELPCEDFGGDVRGWFVFVVQLPHGVDRDDTIRALLRARRAVQAVPARDPPDVLLPRALRPPRGRVPGLRGRRGALDRAAVLPGDDGGRRSPRSPRRWSVLYTALR